VESAATRFEPCQDVAMGGLLAGLPALCENGLLSGLGRHLSLPGGFYSAMDILFLLGFMALTRIRRPLRGAQEHWLLHVENTVNSLSIPSPYSSIQYRLFEGLELSLRNNNCHIIRR
jgi:hypothetical protein